MFLNELVGLILNTLFPTIIISLFSLIIGIYTIWIAFKLKNKPTKIQGLALISLGFSYLFSYLRVGDSDLRHAMIRFTLVWVILSIGMMQFWRMKQYDLK